MPYRTVTRVLDEPCLGRLVLYGDYTMEYYGSQQDAAPPCAPPRRWTLPCCCTAILRTSTS